MITPFTQNWTEIHQNLQFAVSGATVWELGGAGWTVLGVVAGVGAMVIIFWLFKLVLHISHFFLPGTLT